MSYPVNIGEAAPAAGLTAKMIRDYEAVGFVAQASRAENGDRPDTNRDVDMPRFIRQARSMRFSSCPGDARADCPNLSKLSDYAAPAALSNELRQRLMRARTRREAPSYIGLAARSRALNGGLAAQHA